MRKLIATAATTSLLALAGATAATSSASAASGYTYGPKGSCWVYSTAYSKPVPAYREYYRGRPTGRCVVA